jgi:hypothetical protein
MHEPLHPAGEQLLDRLAWRGLAVVAGKLYEQGRSRQSSPNHDSEISHRHGYTLIGTVRKNYGQSFAAGYPVTDNHNRVAQCRATRSVGIAAIKAPGTELIRRP